MSRPRAHLDDRPGHGYAVVESLPSLGKGRACTGLFTTTLEQRDHFRQLLQSGRRVRFRGTIHSRHRSGRAALDVGVTSLWEEEGELLVEFGAEAVPYDILE